MSKKILYNYCELFTYKSILMKLDKEKIKKKSDKSIILLDS